jgi:hypothetical protein
MGLFKLHHHPEVAMPTIPQAIAQLKASRKEREKKGDADIY